MMGAEDAIILSRIAKTEATVLSGGTTFANSSVPERSTTVAPCEQVVRQSMISSCARRSVPRPIIKRVKSSRLRGANDRSDFF
jgi:hypothetical protein